jgi:hypothetical protein
MASNARIKSLISRFSDLANNIQLMVKKEMEFWTGSHAGRFHHPQFIAN